MKQFTKHDYMNLFGLVIMVASAILLMTADWKVFMGVFLFVWSNNIGTKTKMIDLK